MAVTSPLLTPGPGEPDDERAHAVRAVIAQFQAAALFVVAKATMAKKDQAGVGEKDKIRSSLAVAEWVRKFMTHATCISALRSSPHPQCPCHIAVQDPAPSAHVDFVDEEVTTKLVERMRQMYRKSVEYRVAHSLFESKFRDLRISLSFFHLLLSSVTGAVLFLGLPPAVSGGLAFALTGLNSAMKAVNLAALEAGHTRGRVIFAGLQRALATTLTLCKNAEVADEFALVMRITNRDLSCLISSCPRPAPE